MPRKMVSVLILNWNSASDTIHLLALMREQSYRDFHPIVIDNHSADDSIERIAPYEGYITLVRNSKNMAASPLVYRAMIETWLHEE